MRYYLPGAATASEATKTVRIPAFISIRFMMTITAKLGMSSTSVYRGACPLLYNYHLVFICYKGHYLFGVSVAHKACES